MKNFIKRIAKFLIFLGILAVATYFASFLYLHRGIEHPPVGMEIQKGTSVSQITEILGKSGVIKCPTCFKFYVLAMGMGPKLRAGEYEFESGLSPYQVLQKLLKGDYKRYRVTVIEGWTVKQIADHLKTLAFVVSPTFSDDFVKLTADPEFIKTLNIGWEVPSLEGYLFPNTYEVYKLRDPKKLIEPMVDEFKKRFVADILAKSPALGLKPADIVTLASIVEKETGGATERDVVASVFYNRIKKGMPLQSDPTVIYGLTDYDGNITRADLQNPHKYNTYVHAGIPPGPIANPGAAAINAVLNPATSNFLYFVSKNNGTHKFSETLDEHNRAVQEYQRK